MATGNIGIGRLGACLIIDVQGARCVLLVLGVLLNTVPRGGGLNLSDARNGGSSLSREGGTDLLCVRAEFSNECIIFDREIRPLREEEHILFNCPVAEVLDLISPFTFVPRSKYSLAFSTFCPSNLYSFRSSGATAMLSVALISCRHVRASFQEKIDFQ
jgi:hypothetical protein